MQGGGFFAEDDVEPIQPPVPVRRPAPMPARPALPQPPRLQPPRPQPHGGGNYDPRCEDYDDEGEAALDDLLREESAESQMWPAMHAERKSEPAVAPAAPAVGVCADCGESSGQPKFFDAFGLSACYDCQRADKGPGGKYQLMTKSKAKDEYLLTDRHLSREHGGLGCLLHPNPHANGRGGNSSDMRLYLRTQVETLALSVWGSDEALFTERERRLEARCVNSEARKRKAASKEAAARNGTNLVPETKRPAASARRVPNATVSHTHVFLPDETYDEASDQWTKRCACGFTVEYERL